MRPTQLLALLFIVAIALPFAAADFSTWPALGGDEQNTRFYIGANREANVEETYSTSFSHYNRVFDGVTYRNTIQPLILDTDADGSAEIWLQADNDTLAVIDGVTNDILATAPIVGNADPTSCDFDGDGRKEYVTIDSSDGFVTMFFLSYANGSISVVDDALLLFLNASNALAPQTNIVCGDFNGNTSAFFLARNKTLVEVHKVGVVTTVTNRSNPFAPTFNTPAQTPRFRTNQILLLQDFSANTDGDAIIYMSGRNVFLYNQNAHETLSLAGDFGATVCHGYTLHAYKGSLSSKERVFVNCLRPSNGGTVGPVTVASIRHSPSLLLADLTSQVVQFTAAGGLDFFTQNAVVADFNSDGSEDLGIVVTRTAAGASNSFVIIKGNNLDVDWMANGTAFLPTNYNHASPISGAGDVATHPGPYMMSSDYNKDGRPDILVPVRDASNAGSNCYAVSYGPSFLDASNEVRTAFCHPGTVFDAGWAAGVASADINADGHPDFVSIITEPTGTPGTRIFSSAPDSTASITNPFSVAKNTTSPAFSAVFQVTAGYDTHGGFFNYAVACDVKDEEVYSEVFKTGYNFSVHNVSTSTFPPEDDLTPYSLLMQNNGTFDYYSILKQDATAVDGHIRQSWSMSANTTSSFFYVVTSGNGFITNFLRFELTPSQIGVYKVFPGFSEVSVGNITMTGVGVPLTFVIQYVPITDSFSSYNYYGTRITVNGNSVTNTSTAQYDGKTIKNVEFFSNTTNTKHNWYGIALEKTGNIEPVFVGFQNSISFEEGGFTTEIPSPQSEYVGDGFVVQAGENSVFYSVCTYDSVGTKKTRHYLAPINTIDYSNYKDVTVTVTNATSTGTETGIIPLGGVNAVTDFITNVFGITSIVGGFFLWIVFMGIIGFLTFPVHPGFGMVSMAAMLLLGVLIGVVPIWIVVLLVILGAFLFMKIYAGFGQNNP